MKANTKEEIAEKILMEYLKGKSGRNLTERAAIIEAMIKFEQSYHTSQSKPTPGDKYCEGWEDGRKAGIEEAQSKLPTNEQIEKQYPITGEMPITETDRINTYKQEVAKWMRGKSNKQEIAKWLKTQSQLLTNAEIKEMAMEAQSKQITDEKLDNLAYKWHIPEDRKDMFIKEIKEMCQSQLQGEGWISIEDRLPEKVDNEPIMCDLKHDCSGEPMEGYYDEDTWWIKPEEPAVGYRSINTLSIEVQITHWKPQPPNQ